MTSDKMVRRLKCPASNPMIASGANKRHSFASSLLSRNEKEVNLRSRKIVWGAS
jgi:hypothetical protein